MFVDLNHCIYFCLGTGQQGLRQEGYRGMVGPKGWAPSELGDSFVTDPFIYHYQHSG